MGQVIADIFTISISGFLNLRNALIDYLINPLDFDSLLSEIRKKILQTVPTADQTFCPAFTFKEEKGAGSKRTLVVTVYRKDRPLFSVPLEIIETESAYNKKVSVYLIYIGENYRLNNQKKQ